MYLSFTFCAFGIVNTIAGWFYNKKFLPARLYPPPPPELFTGPNNERSGYFRLIGESTIVICGWYCKCIQVKKWQLKLRKS